MHPGEPNPLPAPPPHGGAPPPVVSPPPPVVAPPPSTDIGTFPPEYTGPPQFAYGGRPSVVPGGGRTQLIDEPVIDAWRAAHGYAQGGKAQLIDEPVVAMGMNSGQPKFTMGEKTAGFPEGIPETATVSPDGQTLDIDPFGQTPETAASGILDSAQKRFREARGNPNEIRNIIQETVDAFSALMRNGKMGESGMDAFRAQHGVLSPKEQDFVGTLEPPAAVSPEGMPPPPAQGPSNFPQIVSSLVSGAGTIAEAKKRLRKTAAAVRR